MKFKKGEEILVGDEKPCIKAIFLAYIENAEYPYVCVQKGYENEYQLGKTFSTDTWRCGRKLEIEYRPYTVDELLGMKWEEFVFKNKQNGHFYTIWEVNISHTYESFAKIYKKVEIINLETLSFGISDNKSESLEDLMDNYKFCKINKSNGAIEVQDKPFGKEIVV